VKVKSFHIHAPVRGKAQRPTVESLTAGTDRLSVVEDHSLHTVFGGGVDYHPNTN